MKKFKKIAALLLAMVMTIAMAVPAFAETNTTNSDKSQWTADVTVSGLSSTTTAINAYKFIDVSYSNGVVTYSLEDWAKSALANVDAAKLNDVVDVDTVVKALGGTVGTASETESDSSNDTQSSKDATGILAALAKYTGAKSTPTVGTISADKTTATFSNLVVGSYLVVATDSNNIYNPMMVSVKYTDTNGTINGVEANNTSAKYSSVPFDKEMVQDDTSDTTYGATDSKVKGDDYQVGDTVNYKLTNTIPNYDLENYTNIEYYITDTMSEGLDFQNDVVVKVDGTVVTTGYTVTTSGRTIKIDMADLVTTDNLNKPVEITYSAKLNSNAVTGFDPNTNTATLHYTNDPDPNAEAKTIDKTTNTYTFAIDGSILAKGSNQTIGHEVKKTGVDKWSTETTASDIIYSEYAALSGATFTLYTKNSAGKLVEVSGITNTAESGTDGRILFKGLEGDTTYYLKETAAPEGYSINDTVYAIKFVPTFDNDGNMTIYKVLLDSATDATDLDATTELVTYTIDDYADDNPSVTVSYRSTGKTVTTDTGSTESIETEEIRNTQLTSLPSTGGIGTTIFTIAGCAIMIAAGGMLIVSRRRKNA